MTDQDLRLVRPLSCICPATALVQPPESFDISRSPHKTPSKLLIDPRPLLLCTQKLENTTQRVFPFENCNNTPKISFQTPPTLALRAAMADAQQQLQALSDEYQKLQQGWFDHGYVLLSLGSD
jgi:hypothetical protein